MNLVYAAASHSADYRQLGHARLGRPIYVRRIYSSPLEVSEALATHYEVAEHRAGKPLNIDNFRHGIVEGVLNSVTGGRICFRLDNTRIMGQRELDRWGAWSNLVYADGLPEYGKRGQIVGLTGVKRSGKDSAAEALVLSNLQFHRFAFADKLRLILKDVYGLTDDQVSGPEDVREAVIPEWGKSGRKMLQLLGTEVGRALHVDTWVRYIRRAIEPHLEAGYNVVLSDVRYPNEAQLVYDLGGQMYRMRRTAAEKGHSDTHTSETSLWDFQAEDIWNDGTLAELHEQILGRVSVNLLRERINL